MATRTISNGGGNYNSIGSWVEGAVPTSSDNVVATATSGNLTITAAADALSVDLTGYVGTLTHNAFTWSVVKNLNLATGMTYTLSGSANCKIQFTDTSSGNTITTNGKSLPNLLFNGVGGVWTLQDNLIAVITTVNFGTLNANNFNCDILKLVVSSSVNAIVTMGSGTWTISGTTTSVSIGSASVLNYNTATIVLANTTGNNTKTIDFGGKTVYSLFFNSSALANHKYFISNDVTVSNVLTIIGKNHIQISAGFTVTAVADFVVLPSAGVVKLSSDSAGSVGYIVAPSGSHSYSNMDITDNDISGSGGNYFAYASVDGGGNVGWTFVVQDSMFFAGD
jgi:hypothetical protein